MKVRASRPGSGHARLLIAWVVAILVAAMAVPAPSAAAATTPFTDIAGTTFEADIEWMFAEGITVGCSASAYCPNRAVTRAEMASFLVRMFDLTVGWDVDAFTDDDGTTHEADINRLAQADITTGCTATTFCPTASVRRDEMASFLVRGIPLTVGAGRDYFYDDNENSHEADIDRAAAAGVTNGCATWRYCPAGTVTRGHMAAYLHRVVKPTTPPPYPAPPVRTLFVGQSGSDQANDCVDELEPCATIGHAVAVSHDGDTVRLAAGTYHEGALFVQTSLTFVGAGRDTTIVDGAAANGPVFNVYVANSVPIRFRSMTVTGGNLGGIRSYGDATIEDVRVAGNQANTFGGGIFNAGTMTIRRSVIVDNDATGSGGGIWSSTRLTIDDSTICGNTAQGQGGGIAADSHASSKYLRINRSLICDNSAVGGGGGVMIHATPSTISNTTIASNRVLPSPDFDRGGGILADAVTVLGATITGNSAGAGGGMTVYSSFAGTVLVNTLVVANLKGGNVTGMVSSEASSIIGVPAGLTLADILVPGGPKDNGGPTKTIALTDSATNPARHHGDAATCAGVPVSGLDQRGLPRTAPCDIGAYELQP